MSDLDKTLADLQERVRSVEKSYNPERLNLHFDIPVRTDSALFEELYHVGLEAWNMIRVNPSWETLHWFYDFFLLISSASVKILNDHTQNEYPKDVIERIALLLVEISQMTSNKEFQGDISSRNYEALANVLLAFHNYGDLRNLAIMRAEEKTDPNVINFVKWTIEAVKEIESKRTAPSTQSISISKEKTMDKKTEGVKILVQDVLAAEFSEPYGEDIILEVCQAIENNREWRRRYDELSTELRAWVVNNWIGLYVKDETGLNSLRKVSGKGKSNIITAYTKLGR